MTGKATNSGAHNYILASFWQEGDCLISLVALKTELIEVGNLCYGELIAQIDEVTQSVHDLELVEVR